ILDGKTWQSCLVYNDDIVLYSCTFQEQVQNIQQVFGRLSLANLHSWPQKVISN
ncbi:hypothetical protein BDK51DRAFT_19510, partial [Blyttiomyces helicus]